MIVRDDLLWLCQGCTSPMLDVGKHYALKKRLIFLSLSIRRRKDLSKLCWLWPHVENFHPPILHRGEVPCFRWTTTNSYMACAIVSIPLTTDDTEVQKNLKNWCFFAVQLFWTKNGFFVWADCSVGAPPFHHSKLLISSKHCHSNVIKISHLMSHWIGKFNKNWGQNWVWGCKFSRYIMFLHHTKTKR